MTMQQFIHSETSGLWVVPIVWATVSGALMYVLVDNMLSFSLRIYIGVMLLGASFWHGG